MKLRTCSKFSSEDSSTSSAKRRRNMKRSPMFSAKNSAKPHVPNILWWMINMISLHFSNLIIFNRDLWTHRGLYHLAHSRSSCSVVEAEGRTGECVQGPCFPDWVVQAERHRRPADWGSSEAWKAEWQQPWWTGKQSWDAQIAPLAALPSDLRWAAPPAKYPADDAATGSFSPSDHAVCKEKFTLVFVLDLYNALQ